MVWYGLVEILKLNSRPWINQLMTRVGIELLGQLKSETMDYFTFFILLGGLVVSQTKLSWLGIQMRSRVETCVKTCLQSLQWHFEQTLLADWDRCQPSWCPDCWLPCATSKPPWKGVTFKCDQCDNETRDKSLEDTLRALPAAGSCRPDCWLLCYIGIGASLWWR